MAECTIKTTRRLHKPHNIFVADLMITILIISLLATLQSSIMVIGHITGVGAPDVELYCTFLMISVDKMIAIYTLYRS